MQLYRILIEVLDSMYIIECCVANILINHSISIVYVAHHSSKSTVLHSQMNALRILRVSNIFPKQKLFRIEKQNSFFFSFLSRSESKRVSASNFCFDFYCVCVYVMSGLMFFLNKSKREAKKCNKISFAPKVLWMIQKVRFDFPSVYAPHSTNMFNQ